MSAERPAEGAPPAGGGGLAVFLATGAYTGYLRPYPANWASLAATFAAFLLPGGLSGIRWAAAGLLVVSVLASGAAERRWGKDHYRIVIDEWAGMFVALAFVPREPWVYLATLLAFRFFDTAKLPPTGLAERLPGGWGVTADDVVAGLQAGVVMALLLRL